MSTATEIQSVIAQAIDAGSRGSARSVQSAEGIIGPSDLGFCRNKAALMTKGVAQSDSKSLWAASVGTAIHEYIGAILREMFPDWIVDSQRVTATFPSGAEVSGTPVLIVPEWNALLDAKTVDGFAWVKRNGTSQNHKFQRHTYALGAIQAGLLDESKPIYVGNIYLDRSGKEKEPYVTLEPFDPTLTDQVDTWISDVIYAVKHDEEASKDIAPAVCEQICEFFTVCRGNLPDTHDPMLILEGEQRDAIRMYVEARDMAKEADKMKRAAQARLVGVEGSDGEWQVRWTHIPESEVSAFRKQGYDRMDIRKVRKQSREGL
jgi:hypothetical protein